VATSRLRRHDDGDRCSLILIVSSDHSFHGDRCISNSGHSTAYVYSSPDLIHILFGSSVGRFASCSGDVRKAAYQFAFASGALRWGVYGSQFIDAMDASCSLVHFSCTRVFFLLRFCIKFGCVWSRKGFGVRYRRGRNVIPLS
jgi:hypothetical protein